METRKKVLILFGKAYWDNTAPRISEKYRISYEYLYQMAADRGVDLFRSSIDWYDEDKKIFTNAWTFQDNKWITARNIKPDLVYDKTKLAPHTELAKGIISKDFRITNDPAFTSIINNKLCSSLIFPHFMKKCHLVKNHNDLMALSDKIHGEKIVLKPASGSGGADVHILDKSEIDSFTVDKPYLAQEFIDGSSGIKGIVKGYHDLRLVFVNNDLIYSYIRQPKNGSLLSNLAQGGSMFIVKKKDLPQSLFQVIESVQETFSCFSPKVYTIDFIFDDNQKPWIVELNSMPGIYFSPDQKEWQDKFYSELINIYLTA